MSDDGGGIAPNASSADGVPRGRARCLVAEECSAGHVGDAQDSPSVQSPTPIFILVSCWVEGPAKVAPLKGAATMNVVKGSNSNNI